tara:strand:- start:187 stop:588 length:402 start_codon:yes stop_codon:yes gene_type:complete
LNKLLKPDPYYNDNLATLGDRLFAARENCGLTQNVLAKKLGIRVKTLVSWENDNLEPNANKVQMISGFLNVSIVWLISGLGSGVDNEVFENEKKITNNNVEMLLEIQSVKLEQQKILNRLSKLEKLLRNNISN